MDGTYFEADRIVYKKELISFSCKIDRSRDTGSKLIEEVKKLLKLQILRPVDWEISIFCHVSIFHKLWINGIETRIE